MHSVAQQCNLQQREDVPACALHLLGLDTFKARRSVRVCLVDVPPAWHQKLVVMDIDCSIQGACSCSAGALLLHLATETAAQKSQLSQFKSWLGFAIGPFVLCSDIQ